MKQTNLLSTFRLRALTLVTLLCTLFATQAWAEDADVTYDFTGSDWSVSDGALTDGTVSFTGAGGANFKMNSGYFILGKSGAYLNFPTYSSPVEKIVITGNSGASGSVAQNIYVGDVAVSTATTGATGTNTYEIATDYQDAGTQYTLKISSNHNTQITKIEIFFASGGGSSEKSDCDLALTGTTDLEFDLYNNADAQVINYTTSSTGAVTIANSNYATFDVDETNKTITVTPLKKTNGEVEITVNQAADDNYKAGSATFTVTITDSTPKTGAWELTSLADLEDGDVFVIVGNNYAMTNDNGTGSAPVTVAVTIENDEITSDVDDNIKWNISGNATDGYTFYPNGDTDTWLYCNTTAASSSNNNMRVGTGDRKVFVMDSDNYLVTKDTYTARYVSIYNNADWRGYVNTNSAPTISFYKYVDGTATPKVLESISLSGEYPTTFHVGDAFSTEGMTVTANYEGGKTKDVTSSATFTGYDMATAGEQTVTVSYTENEVVKTTTYNITVNAPATLTSITLSGTYPTTFEQGDEFSSEGIVVTANFDDNTTSDVTADASFSGYDMSTLGEQTVTVTYNEKTAQYNITVNEKKGVENNPYTVAQAIEATPTSGTSANVYIHGIVSAFYNTSIVGDGTNYRYYISDDGTTDSQLLVYRGKGLNEATFANASDLEIGDEVVIYGKLTTYQNAPEIASGNYLVSLDRKLAAPIISGDDKYLGSTDVTINSNVEGATILYSLDNGATWNTYTDPFKISNQTVTVMAKATKDEQESEVASMTFTCMNNQENWVSEAIEALDENPSWEDKWIMGYVWEVGTLSDGSLTYTITDDFGDNKPGDNLILVVNGKGLNGADFTATTDLERGQDITISGNLVKDGDVYKFEDGSQIEDINELSDNPISAYGDIELYASDLETTADVHDYINVDSENIGAFTFVSNDPTIATVDENGIVTPVSPGNTTITVNQAMHWGLYRAGSTTVNVIVNSDTKTDNNFVLSSESETTPYGTPVVLTYMVSEGYTGEIEVVTVNPSAIADVTVEPSNQTITITPKAVGSAVIRIDANQDASFFTANKYVEVTVTAPEGQTDAAITSVTLFNETFDKCDGNGGRDEVFTGSVGTGSTDEKLDESWNSIGNNAASQCIKLGTGKAFSGVTTSSIALTGNGTLTFSAAGWGDSNTNKVNVTAEGASLSGDTEVTLANGEWNSYTVNITEATGDVIITFSMKRGFLDDVLVKSEGESLSVKLNDYGYATYCSQYPLDFNGVTEYTAWLIDEVNDNVITFSQIGRDIKGGQGILLKGTPGATIMLNSVNSDFTLEDNKLIGITAPTYVKSGEYYGLSGNSFVKVGTTTIPAGKALLPASLIDGSTASRLTFVFEESETTGIHSVENGQSTIENGNWYTLGGQKMNGKPATKGVYIINGKKVVIK